MKENTISVLLADDTLIAREGWKGILALDDTIVVVGEATSTLQAENLASELSPDVVLMDLKWSGDATAGAAAINAIKVHSPNIGIIAITAYEHLIRDARRAGANYALTKTFTIEELLSRIKEVAAREEPVLPAAPTTDILDDLTPRQLEILELLAQGQTNQEIADELLIAYSTARKYVRILLEKLGVSNRVQAATLAVRHGLGEHHGGAI